MSTTYEEMLKHVDHDMKLLKDDVGDIILYCADCNETLESWEKPPVNVWHGRLYGADGGDIGEIHGEEQNKEQGELA